MQLNNPYTLGFLDPTNKEFFLQKQKKIKMGNLHSCQSIQNNMNGHEQTSYQRSNCNVRLNFQICHPYQIG
jgi:hypothetical protein